MGTLYEKKSSGLKVPVNFREVSATPLSWKWTQHPRRSNAMPGHKKGHGTCSIVLCVDTLSEFGQVGQSAGQLKGAELIKLCHGG